MVGREVSELDKVICEAVVRDLDGLRGDIHSVADIDKDVAVLDKWWDILGINDILGNQCDGNAHVFVLRHWGV